MYVTAILEFSEDDLTVSNASASWQDVTNVLLEARWNVGVRREGDDPAPAQATFVLDDRSRDFEPEYGSGSYAGSIVPFRRFRWRIESDTVTYSQGVWYAVAFKPSWPTPMMQETAVTCADGMPVLEQDRLPTLDPPEAQTYADVVLADKPFGYWRLGDPVTAAKAEAVTGPEGAYKNRYLVTLGQPGAILGDTDTAVRLQVSGTDEGRAHIPMSATEYLSDGQSITVEVWAKMESGAGNRYVITGPVNNSLASPIWQIEMDNNFAGTVIFEVLDAGGTYTAAGISGSLSTGQWYHVVGTYGQGHLRLYLDGVLVDEENGVPRIVGPSLGNPLIISDTAFGFVGTVDEVAVYEHALTAERVLAHYQAGAARGFAQETAGERIAALATSDIWSEASIVAGTYDVLPRMMVGQSRMDEIRRTMQAEGPRTLFFFDGTGDPVYLGRDWRATDAAYHTPQATLGNDTGEVPFADIELDYDDETYTVCHASREGGELITVGDENAVPRRVRDSETGLLLTTDVDVTAVADEAHGLYETPAFRPVQVTLDGDDPDAREHILTAQIGHMVRVKHRPRGGTAIDRVANIIGMEIRLERETGKLTADWYLSRGFNAATGYWRAGVVGFSEAGSTTKAA